MTITEIRKKVRHLTAMLRQYESDNTLARHMEKSEWKDEPQTIEMVARINRSLERQIKQFEELLK